ncbi:MAG: glycoside hydrolase family 97 catalytic domain-containing protein, partial [Cytophagaceae bacterium]|nr:glycoside hydrolase family 97 catalytic domain-containing protein [Cytophagaceae bacterium]
MVSKWSKLTCIIFWWINRAAYNDGVAFRYSWPKTGAVASFDVLDEVTQFNVTGNPKATVLCFPNYTSSHETNYTVANLGQIPVDTLMDLPALFEVADNLLVAVTEANLHDYPGMYLARTSSGKVVSKLSPLPKGNGVKAKLKTPHHSPWRVLMIGKTPGTLIESNLVLNLSEPCAVKDVSWIRTHKSTWPWWNDTVVPENAPFKRGMNYESMKYYIDFAAKYGISCHALTDVDGDSWYTSPLSTYPLPGPGTDVTKPNPRLRMDSLLAYANSKGVRLRLWVHWKALEPQLEAAFTTYEKWGIEGLMVDYMDRDDQEMVNFYHRVIESAARHKLSIEFHGAYKPTGLRRTYPN